MKETLDRKIANMTQEQLLDGMFRDALTQIWNRRAFEQTPDSEFVALVDFDSLKWINDNEGHRAGDTALYNLAQSLEKQFPDRVFRISGDEFVVRSDDEKELYCNLVPGDCFSFGVGHNIVEADTALRNNKTERTVSGLRAVRGEKPTYLK